MHCITSLRRKRGGHVNAAVAMMRGARAANSLLGWPCVGGCHRGPAPGVFRHGGGQGLPGGRRAGRFAGGVSRSEVHASRRWSARWPRSRRRRWSRSSTGWREQS